ncbi:MAG: ADP-ribose pyrophosphatase [Clostridiales bacterium]|jgi:8-oxo-dGTP diphosphatase|nr:ADP-ribose pyrophosphatase [Clostridiales bacterium]
MKEIHVVGAAIMDGIKLLAAQRSKIMKEPLKWEFPGGKVEEGENHAEALKREISEELGIDIEVQGFIGTGSSVVEDKKILLHVYKAGIVCGEPYAREHAQLRWIEIRELQKLDWAAADVIPCRLLIEGF